MDLGKRQRTEHRYTEERLSAYLDGELTPQERVAVEQHLASCQTCRWNLHTLQQTVHLVAGLPTIPIPRAFTIPVTTRRARAPRRSWSLPLLQGATALVALLLVVVVAGDLLLTGLLPATTSRTAVNHDQALPAISMPTAVAQVPEEVRPQETIARETADKLAVATPSLPAQAPASLPEEIQAVIPTEAPPATSLPAETQAAISTETPPPVPLPADAPAKAALPPTATESAPLGGGPPAGEGAAITETETTAVRLLAPGPAVTETVVSKVEATEEAVRAAKAMEAAVSEERVTETEKLPATALPTPTEAEATFEASGYQAAPQTQPTEPPAPAEPTVVSLVQERTPAVETGRELSDSAVVWLGVAEIALLAAFVLLASATLLAMIRQRRIR